MSVFGALIVLAAGGALALWALLRMRRMDLWIGGYVRRRLRRPRREPRDVYFCFADHYEPYWNGADKAEALRRVREWCARYPAMADRHRDARGRVPQHTYFYPEEEYDPDALDLLAGLCRRGYGDVEVHLHHDNDTSAGVRAKLAGFARTLHERHGFLRKNPATGLIEYGFIHGNWALDNSRPDGRWCGVNDELAALKETGCYADFTMPSAPSDTQTRKVNSLYFAADDPARPKSHDTGRDVRFGEWDDSALLMVQGPLELNWRSRKWGVLPRIENGEISHDNPPTAHRTELWGRPGIGVAGRPEAVFIKVHSHGLQDRNLKAFFDGGYLDRLYSFLTERYSERNGHRLFFVTAREMYEAVRSLASGRPEAVAAAEARS